MEADDRGGMDMWVARRRPEHVEVERMGRTWDLRTYRVGSRVAQARATNGGARGSAKCAADDGTTKDLNGNSGLVGIR